MDATGIIAISAAVVTVVGAVAAGTVTVIKALRETKDVNADNSAKLTTITAMVNGQYGAVLRELADVRRLLASATGLREDKAGALGAEKVADDHEAVIKAAKDC